MARNLVEEVPLSDVPAVEGVRRTIAEYCHFVDGGRADDWLNLFTDDATMAVDQYGSLQGRASLTRFISAILEGVSDGPGINHLTLNEVIHIDGPTATGMSYVLVVVPDGQGGFAVPLVGRYHDDFIDNGDRWRFTHRRLSWFNDTVAPAFRPLLERVFAAVAS